MWGLVGDIILYSVPSCHVLSSATVSRRLRHYKAVFLVFFRFFILFLALGKRKTPEKNIDPTLVSPYLPKIIYTITLNQVGHPR